MGIWGLAYSSFIVSAEGLLPVENKNISMESAGEKAEFEFGCIEKLNTNSIVTVSSSDYSVISFSYRNDSVDGDLKISYNKDDYYVEGGMWHTDDIYFNAKKAGEVDVQVAINGTSTMYHVNVTPVAAKFGKLSKKSFRQ